jgi:hypothetical protein
MWDSKVHSDQNPEQVVSSVTRRGATMDAVIQRLHINKRTRPQPQPTCDRMISVLRMKKLRLKTQPFQSSSLSSIICFVFLRHRPTTSCSLIIPQARHYSLHGVGDCRHLIHAAPGVTGSQTVSLAKRQAWNPTADSSEMRRSPCPHLLPYLSLTPILQ